eukprot:TRINITY_DN3078_c0_g1_i1.p1 TRINITY_DN3078_c0_g1~~TRINITY_DN3078_c0_g1_i1.p1  ORF type:complete len:688 (+),score=144.67 TRINITY_DN3078_c0_g1_i1:64-2127(+)
MRTHPRSVRRFARDGSGQRGVAMRARKKKKKTQGGTTSWQQLASGGPRLEYEMPEAGAPPGPFPTYPVESCDASSACQSSSDDVWMAFKPAGLLHTSLIDAVSLSYTAIPFHPIQREEVRRAVAIAYDVNAEQVQLNAFSQTAPDSYNRSDATASFNIWSYAELPSFGEAMSEQSQQYAQESVVLASSYVAADNQRIQGRGREIAQSHHHDLGNALVQVCPPSSKLHNAPTGDVKISSVQQGAEAATFPPTVVPMAAAPQVPIQVATSPPADIAVGPALQIVGTAEVVAASQEDRAKLTNAQGQGVLQAALASIAAVPQDAVTLEALSLGGTSASLQARRLQLASGSAPLTVKFAVTAANPSQARRLQLASGSAPLTVKFAVTAANPSQGDDIQQALLKVAHANTAMSPDASQLLGTLNTMTQPGSQYPLAATLPSANIVPGYTYARVWTPDTPKPTVPPPAPAPPMPAAAPAAVPEHMYHKATAGDANSSSISVWWWVLGLAVLLALGALAAFAYFRSKKSKRGVQKSREVGGSISRDAESGARAHDYEAAGSEAMDSAAPALLAAEATAPLHAAMGSEAPRAAVPPSGNDEPWIFPSTAPHGLHGQAANVFATNAAAASSFGSRPLLQMAQQSMAQLQTRASQAAPDFASFQRSQAYAAVPAAPQFQFQPQPLASSYFQNSMRLH